MGRKSMRRKKKGQRHPSADPYTQPYTFHRLTNHGAMVLASPSHSKPKLANHHHHHQHPLKAVQRDHLKSTLPVIAYYQTVSFHRPSTPKISDALARSPFYPQIPSARPPCPKPTSANARITRASTSSRPK